MAKVGKSEERDEALESERLLLGLEEGLEIDRDDLDEAHIQQPSIFHRVSDEHARAVSRRDQAKLRYEDECALADKEIRESLDDEDRKPTETQIKHQVSRDPDVRKAHEEFLRWSALVNRWSALLESYKQRGHSLKGLTELFVAGYFSRAENRKARASASDRASEQAREALAEERRRRGS